MTRAQLIIEIRDQLRDTEAEYRWSTTKILRYSDHGVDLLWKTHPEAFMENTIPTDRPTRISSMSDGTDIGVTRTYEQTLIHYVTALCLAEDSQHGSGQAMQSHLQLAEMEA